MWALDKAHPTRRFSCFQDPDLLPTPGRVQLVRQPARADSGSPRCVGRRFGYAVELLKVTVPVSPPAKSCCVSEHDARSACRTLTHADVVGDELSLSTRRQ